MLGFADDDAAARCRHPPVPAAACRSRSTATTSREFAAGLSDVLVIEEKNPTLELLVRDALYDVAERPRVWGKQRRGRPRARPVRLAARRRSDDAGAAPPSRQAARRPPGAPAPAARPSTDPADRRPGAPFFCSGCPHNTSTAVEPGTLVGGGIGCHGMVAMMEPERIGELVGLTCMGSEGAQWIGMAPFVERQHLVRTSATARSSTPARSRSGPPSRPGIDITYKLLHNGTVAMTGGQDAQGAVDVPAIATMLMAEGVKRIIITADDPARHDGVPFPAGVAGLGPEPLRRGAAHARRGEGHDRADPRPGVRRREAPRAQPWNAGEAGIPRGHQRAHLRRLRRLRRPVELPVGAAHRHAVRSQDGDPSDELQLRPLVHEGRLPGVRHRHGRSRRTGDEALGTGRRRPRIAARSSCDRRRRPVHGAAVGDRRHRRHHGQPDHRHGRDARRVRGARSRPDRAVTEGRAGHERRPRHHG